jgi:tellurite methyltransferase
MNRVITGFGQDEDAHWVAHLDCGHDQHVRHDPPLVSRPWVLNDETRRAHLGTVLDCVRCERLELPAHFTSHKKTPVFTEVTVPAGLRKEHSTRAGVWAKIHVLQGRLRYRIGVWEIDTILTSEACGIVVPEVSHSVEPQGIVRFFVEFFSAPGP